MAEPAETFGGLLRELRRRTRLTQEQLADAAGLSLRALSDLERGVVATPQKETVRMLADALRLTGQERTRFETVARGRPLHSVSQTAAATAIRSLPRDVASFIGRERELEQLLEAAAGASGVVGIHAIGGMAGVGKTAFAVHAAHRLADRFPAGQIFLQLHGHTPGQRPVDSADALASLLLSIGMPPSRIPAGLAERAALWRDRVTGKQLLLVLDDAASSDQVEPLLPGAGGSLVLVTSRVHLSALTDAAAISLDTLPPDEAAALFVRLAGRAGLTTDHSAVDEINRLCGFLPLAIGMVARQLRHHQAWTAAGRAAELANTRDRLALLETENLSVAAAFNLSYANLTEDQQRLFRRLGLHPGSDIDGYAAAALDGTDLSAARRGLEDLYDRYLLTEPAQGRYRLHDLIREHARALAERGDPDQDRSTATSRLLDYYQHTAASANERIARQARPVRAGLPTAAPTPVPVLIDTEQALAWARAERASLLACLDHAAGADQHTRVFALTAGLSGLLRLDGPWTDAAARHEAALQAALHLDDRLGQANALSDLGDVHLLGGYYQAAARALGEALAIYRDLGIRLGQANALHYLGVTQRGTGDSQAAFQSQELALDIYRDLGDRLGEANSLYYLGVLSRATSDYPGAIQALDRALGSYRDLGDRLGQANVLAEIGVLRHQTGDYPAAASALEEALHLHGDVGYRVGAASALNDLGSVRLLLGDSDGAARALNEALDIFSDLGIRIGQANATKDLGAVWRQMGDYPAATQAFEKALSIYREIGVALGEANALSYLGAVQRIAGDYPAAARALAEALGIYRDIGDRNGEAEALVEIGTLHHVCGEFALAQECHRSALELARTLAMPEPEANALAGLGRCALAGGDAIAAELLLRQALEILQRIGAVGAPEVLAELTALAASRPAQ
jgi:tetratricopeptide (TPR) repeat protein/transcriptional regulator with XRE-family HTH domain